MSDLIAISYPNHDLAARAANIVRDLGEQGVVKVEDLVIVTRSAKGELSLNQGLSRVGKNTLGGMLLGGIVGGLFFIPVAGLALGAAGAALSTAFKDAGVNDEELKEIASSVQPDCSALFALIKGDPSGEKTVRAIAELGGRVLNTPLPDEIEIKLQGIIDRASI